MNAWTAWDEPRLATLKKHLDDGLSISQAGARMGVSYQAVSRAMTPVA